MQESLDDTILKQDTVRQSRQAVEIGQAMNLSFRLFPIGDVLSRSDDRKRLHLVIEHRLCLEVDRKIRSVRQDKTMVDIARDPLAQDAPQSLIDAMTVFWMHELDKRVEGSGKVLRSNAHQTTELS